jgi:hypothetical protein
MKPMGMTQRQTSLAALTTALHETNFQKTRSPFWSQPKRVLLKNPLLLVKMILTLMLTISCPTRIPRRYCPCISFGQRLRMASTLMILFLWNWTWTPRWIRPQWYYLLRKMSHHQQQSWKQLHPVLIPPHFGCRLRWQLARIIL